MDINDVLAVFKEKIGKEVLAYEDKGDSVIVITKPSSYKYETSYYKVTPNDITVTNPVVCDLDESKIIKL